MSIYTKPIQRKKGNVENPALTPNANPTPADYRIRIGDICGFDFRNTILQSKSNTDSAIYFRKNHLIDLADTIGITTPYGCTAEELRSSIIKHVKDKKSPKKRHYFCKPDLEAILEYFNIKPNSVDTHLETELRQIAGGGIAGQYYHTLLQETYVDVYLSANLGSGNVESRIYYPFIMHPVHEIPESANQPPNCHRYIVDSSYDDGSIDNTDAINTAKRVDADAVVLADEYHNPKETIEALQEGVMIADKFDGDVILPLQPPIDESIDYLLESQINYKQYVIAVGGLKDAPPKDKINAAETVRSRLGDKIHLHGLGFGATEELARALSDTPSLLDSIDYSTPIQSAMSKGPKGDQRMVSAAAEVNAQLVHDLRKLSPLKRNCTSQEQTTIQNSLGRY